ncbi:phenylalanine--tRNA ligase subunit beta [Trichloromonas sp.]|uniref:phenylalanine--tRNA ligase subunit beta n=1 Tax=Trichloromonas sp. TaxID=3069249 RepID=UPI002A41D8DC|nr:phenylalanine--tRNA ligase subunit beta [Trichloromonas sp.]
MIVTYNWLKEYVDFDFTPEELAHRLTMAGLEVDALEKMGAGLDSVIVARLASVEAHPEADRLTLCQVETGQETVQVVCGAKNHRTGDLVALAQVGSILPGDFAIKKSKIRGVVSMGMLCSEKELGLSEESAGIIILPPGLPLGQPVFEALGLKDVRFELGLTPNRPDCLSVVGVAREVAAMAGRPLKRPAPRVIEEGSSIETATSVTIDDPQRCPRYAARLIKGVKIGPSPEWMIRRLESVGMRSINNVVDVTNFVLLELGHPLHAFDFNLLREGRIVVKSAGEGEVFTTLDSQSRELKAADLTICDGQGAVALAGIMGGENSEIKSETTDVLLESAYFDPTTIRRTSKRLGIHTESSHRFERGADVDMVPLALDRAAALIQELAGGTVARGRIDVYPRVLPKITLPLAVARVNAVLGLELTAATLKELLEAIGFVARIEGHQGLRVEVPSFRPDVEREIDLIEEIARLNGYDRIPVTMPNGTLVSHQTSPHLQQVRRVRDYLVGAGFSEMINYSFIAESAWDRIGLTSDDSRRKTVKVLNPLTEEQAVMRTSLVPSVLTSVAGNLAYRNSDPRLFELRPVFQVVDHQELPHEPLRLTVAFCGRRAPEGWAQERDQVDFYDLKGLAEGLLGLFALPEPTWDPHFWEPYLHPGKSCALRCDGALLGSLGEVHPSVLREFDIDEPVYLLDLDLATLFQQALGHPGFRPLSRYPDVYRDSAFLVDEEIPAAQVFSVLGEIKNKSIEEITLFDVYRGAGVPAGKKSLAIRVRYRSLEKTLTDEEIQGIHGKLVRTLEKNLGAEIR